MCVCVCTNACMHTDIHKRSTVCTLPHEHLRTGLCIGRVYAHMTCVHAGSLAGVGFLVSSQLARIVLLWEECRFAVLT